jgi:hypothetical protein
MTTAAARDRVASAPVSHHRTRLPGLFIHSSTEWMLGFRSSGQAVDRSDVCCRCIHGNGRGCLNRRAAGEYAESTKEPLLVLAKQTVAPVDDRLHGSVARHGCSALRS